MCHNDWDDAERVQRPASQAALSPVKTDVL